MPTDDEVDEMFTKICVAGDPVRLRRYLGRADRPLCAGPLCYLAAHGKFDIVRCLVKEYGADATLMAHIIKAILPCSAQLSKVTWT
jgi:hypothetical protein